MSFPREWMCCFCLTVSEQKGSDNRPDRCLACHVVQCRCGTYIKGDNPKLCHGCGAFMPKVEGDFVGTDQTASIYVEKEWIKRNKGKRATGSYYIATGFPMNGPYGPDAKVSAWIGREVVNEDGQKLGNEDVRELTEEEQRLLNMRDPC